MDFRILVIEEGDANYAVYELCDGEAKCIVNTGVRVNLSPGVSIDLESCDYGIPLLRRELLRRDVERLRSIVIDADRVAHSGDKLQYVVSGYRALHERKSFILFARNESRRMFDVGRFRTSETYKTSINSFTSFLGGADLLFEDMSQQLIFDYQSYLKSQGCVKNTISFYMRTLRAIYNRAIAIGSAPDVNLFKKVYVGVYKTHKRAISIEELNRIKNLDLSASPHKELARNIFLFSFYTRGMSFVDIAFLKRGNLQGGRLVYCRRKTGRELQMNWENCMQKIVNKYSKKTSAFLFPFLDDSSATPLYRQYKNHLRRLNKSLKSIGVLAGVSRRLTMYVARHTWASVARDCRVPITVIGEALGHDSERTTRIYLSSINGEIVDDANRLVIGVLR